jgi:endogenous inhibitor of DNA gyrase (YacG/DUF329 family)
MIDLNRWHYAIHQVTGDMALQFNRAAASDLERWAKELRTVADEMEATAIKAREAEDAEFQWNFG